jgi:protein TonB
MFAVLVTLVVHLSAAAALASNHSVRREASRWVEVVVKQRPPPPPEPPPPPPPEPPRKRVVKFKDIPAEVPPDPAPVEAAPRPVARVQGLSASSFAVGGNTGLTVRAGNSLTVAAGDQKLTVDGASRPYTAVSSQPRLKWQPMLEVPEAARKAEIEGKILVQIDLDDAGKVAAVRLVRGLGHGADEACMAAWKQSTWKPAEVDGAPVAVTGIPQKCTIEAIE